MITLHYLTDSRAQRILWMLEEIEVEYELQIHRRLPSGLAPPSLCALHPLGKAPVLVDEGLVLAESAHIIEQLALRHAPHMLPSEVDAAREHHYWMHFAEGSLAPPLMTKHIFDRALERVPFFLRPILGFVPRKVNAFYLRPTTEKLAAFVDAHLAEREFFVGDTLSCADVMMSFACEALVAAEGPGLAKVREYVARLHARPAYQAALERAGVPYMFG